MASVVAEAVLPTSDSSVGIDVTSGIGVGGAIAEIGAMLVAGDGDGGDSVETCSLFDNVRRRRAQGTGSLVAVELNSFFAGTLDGVSVASIKICSVIYKRAIGKTPGYTDTSQSDLSLSQGWGQI